MFRSNCIVDIGDTVSPFELPGTGGEDTEIPTDTLADVVGDGPVVLAFYAFNFHHRVYTANVLGS